MKFGLSLQETNALKALAEWDGLTLEEELHNVVMRAIVERMAMAVQESEPWPVYVYAPETEGTA